MDKKDGERRNWDSEYSKSAEALRSIDRMILLSFQGLCSICLSALCTFGGTDSFRRFGVQCVAIVVLVLISSVLLSSSARRTQAFIVFYFRVVFLVIARLIIGEEDVAYALLLLLPFSADAVSSFGSSLGLAFSGGMTLFFIAYDFAAHFHSGVAVLLCRGALEAGLVLALIYYHRRLVVCGDQLIKTINDRSNLTQAIERLTSANEGYQQYAEEATRQSAERERNRITREIHDVVGYALINVKMLMNVGKLYLSKKSGDLSSVFESAGAQVDSALQETRQILYAQRSLPSRALSGPAALAALVRTFREVAEVDVEINFGNVSAALDARIDKVIFRMVQEGLVNAFKHGNADKVFIHLWRSEDEVLVNVRDNGTGADKSGDGIGLSGMRERLEELGGSLDARKVADGYVLAARIPLSSEAVREARRGA